MEKKAIVVSAGAVVALALLLGPNHEARASAHRPTARMASAAAQPNILFILTDDQDENLGNQKVLMSQLVGQGVLFENSFVSVPLCCPSRASLLTGLFAHNHGVLGNGGSLGGFERFRDLGLESSTLGTWFQAAGYRTGLLGKYFNHYPGTTRRDPAYMAKGWDSWSVFSSDVEPVAYWDYMVNDNHEVSYYPKLDPDYSTDAMARRALKFLDSSEAKDDQPFFLYLAPSAPHVPAEPAPRHKGAFSGYRAPRTGAFNEEDMSDKPSYYRNLPPLTEANLKQIDKLYQAREESLLAVDEMLEALLARLGELGELDHTYIFYTSDNGFQLGQHRFTKGKGVPFEEALRVPLVVRGPGVPAGQTRTHLVANLDLPATFAELAGAKPNRVLEGRSLVPLLGSAPTPESAWRDDILIENWRDDSDEDGIPAYAGLRTRAFKYVEYENGERELYNLENDGSENNNLAGRSDQTAVLQQLAQRLSQRRNCKGEACR